MGDVTGDKLPATYPTRARADRAIQQAAERYGWTGIIVSDKPCGSCDGSGWYIIEDCTDDCNGDGSPCMTTCDHCNPEGR
jgi:hypothetical protein